MTESALFMAIATFGLVFSLLKGTQPRKKQRMMNDDRRLVLTVTFHLWFVMCYDAVLRSASARGNLCWMHVFKGFQLHGEGRAIPCYPLMLLVTEKGKQAESLRLILPRVNPFLCTAVALGMSLFMLYNVLGLNVPAFDDSPKGIMTSRILGKNSGSHASLIDVHQNMDENEQKSMMMSMKRDVSKEHGTVVDMRHLHMMRVAATCDLQVSRSQFSFVSPG